MIRISDAELEVLKVIWDKKEATSIEIIEGLKGFKWNANTIRTLITRLKEKGAIEVAKRSGKQYIYKSLINESKYKCQVMKNYVKKMYHNSLRDFLLDFCRANDVTAEELRSIIDYIEEKNK